MKLLTFEEMAKKAYGMCYKGTPEQKARVEERMKEQAERHAKLTAKAINTGIRSDKDIPMKCDICGNTFSMGQLTLDSNFGYVCKRCENKETC